MSEHICSTISEKIDRKDPNIGGFLSPGVQKIPMECHFLLSEMNRLGPSLNSHSHLVLPFLFILHRKVNRHLHREIHACIYSPSLHRIICTSMSRLALWLRVSACSTDAAVSFLFCRDGARGLSTWSTNRWAKTSPKLSLSFALKSSSLTMKTIFIPKTKYWIQQNLYF